MARVKRSVADRLRKISESDSAAANAVPSPVDASAADRPVLVQADGKFVSAVKASPTLISGPNLWRGFTMEVLETPASEIPPRANLVRHLVCTIDSAEPFHFYWRENGREQRKMVAAGDNLIRSQQEIVGFRWDRAARALILGIDPATMEFIAGDLLPKSSIQYREFYGTPDDYIHQLMRALAADLANGCPTGPVLGESICTSIAAHSLRRYGVDGPKSLSGLRPVSADRLRRVLDYIDSRLALDLSLFELSAVAGVSPFYLTRLFKAQMGKTVHQYVLSQRMERAKRLLRRTSLDIGGIANAVGFPSQSHFSRAFARHTGATPLEFRAHL
jgi:AraC family transcriptional regulator